MDGLDLSRFSSPILLSTLYLEGCSSLPCAHGVYVVVRDSDDPPVFVEMSSGGCYKGLDPSYPADFVRGNWVPGAHVLYVGMSESARGLSNRVRQLVRFGHGHKAPHRGGRLLWHLADAPTLLLRWCETDTAEAAETELIQAFRSKHGVRPFANLAK